MTTDEFTLWAMSMRTYYPKENILPNSQAMELWFLQLKDIPYETAQNILNKWASTNKWSPSIADIRQMASENLVGTVQEWNEAWHEVRMAIRKFGSYREQEALESMSPMTRKVTEQIGFHILCMSEEEDMKWYSEQFRKIYTNYAEKAKQDLMIPQQIKDMLKAIEERRNQ